MNELNPDRINLIIDAIITEFSKIYLTKRYFGEFENPYKEAIRLFTSGYCSIFAMILKRVFEDSTYYTYETSDTEHILVKREALFLVIPSNQFISTFHVTIIIKNYCLIKLLFFI